MATKELKTQPDLPTRRKFVWGLGILSAFAAVGSIAGRSVFGNRNPVFNKPGGKNKTVKMLTQDGRLVEIDESLLPANGKKITNTGLQHWIKR